MAWHARPVFISSTFADMQAERDHLRTYVFPELEERLRQHRHNLEWVDLRMGVATASLAEGDARELQVLKVCLAEVKRCRPFLIVLLGDRYGWVPPPERITAAVNEEGFETEVADRSVTDLEISFGVLDNPDQQLRSFFYFRDALPYAEMPPDVAALFADAYAADPQAAARADQLERLKHRINDSIPGRVRRYSVGWDRQHLRVTGLEAWGRQVLEDIWAEIETETASGAEAPEPSWSQVERDALDDYFEDRARGFVGRKAILNRLLQRAESPLHEGAFWGIGLTGEPGSGKSAIFGELLRQLRTTDALVLAHAAGASPRSASVERMLRRWIEELSTALGIDAGPAENVDPDTIDATFRALLGRMAQQRRVVLAVDALDQFEATTQGRLMTWLPHKLPANVRLIATAVTGEASAALGLRSGVELRPIAPLDSAEAREIAETISARYHRTLEPEVLDELLAKQHAEEPAWGNPLWLVLAVEELNLLDADDFARATRAYSGAPADQLRSLMLDIVAELPTDIAGLYQTSFARAEQLFGMFLARAFIGFIAISRAGWRETDFQSLLPRISGEPWDELRFASLRRLFRGQLRQVRATSQWDFAHAQMRAAAKGYLAALSVQEAEFHTEAAEHLLQFPAEDPLRQTEAMVHLLGALDLPRAAAYYGAHDLTAAECDGATRILADAILTSDNTKQDGLKQIIRLLAVPANPEILGRLAQRVLFDLEKAIADRVGLTVRHELAAKSLECLDQLTTNYPDHAEWQQLSGWAHDKTGDLQFALGDTSAAIESFKKSLTIRERLAKQDTTNSTWRRDRAVALEKIGEILHGQGQNEEALTYYDRSMSQFQYLAKMHPHSFEGAHSLSVSHVKSGDIKLALGRLRDAKKHHEYALAIRENIRKAAPGVPHWQQAVVTSLQRIGLTEIAQGDFAAALARIMRQEQPSAA